MKPTTSIYVALGAVFFASVLSAWLVPVADFLKAFFVVPGVAALAGALLQIARDSAAFDRQKHLQSDDQIFALGANSHMSSVAFDKHASFCEAYMSEVHEAVGTLFRHGPTEKAESHAHTLYNLHREYAAWIPRSIALELEPFERALIRIAADTHLAQSLSARNDESRSRAVESSYRLFKEVLGLAELPKDADANQGDIAVENVKDKVRSILGITELFAIRRFIIERSARFARDA